MPILFCGEQLAGSADNDTGTIIELATPLSPSASTGSARPAPFRIAPATSGARRSLPISSITMGRVTAVKLPDNTFVTNKYDLIGQLTNTFGSRTYPVAYTFDAQGRMKTMKTWQSYAANSGAAVTTWKYDAYRGWLTNKTYDG